MDDSELDAVLDRIERSLDRATKKLDYELTLEEYVAANDRVMAKLERIDDMLKAQNEGLADHLRWLREEHARGQGASA
ncbi:MAG: hypothetical protein HY554_15840 [Elusimicrobia bacterium]|nr:hypothetical protein [Elusimicrobiota bacterium]